jgi:hypothetical protein
VYEPTMRERLEAAIEAIDDHDLHGAQTILKEAIRVIDDKQNAALLALADLDRDLL